MKTKTTAALCAAAIRTELRTAFAGVKFSVKSDNFSGGNSVRIEWLDGPTDDQVSSIVSKYQYGRFNSMDDLYEYTNSRNDIPQAKYIQTRREISDEVNKVVFEYLKGVFSEDTTDNEINTIKYRIIQKCSIPCGATVIGLKALKDFGLTEDVYTLDFKENANTAPETPNYLKVEVAPGEVSIIDYSEKAIAVIGDTKSIKDQLKDLGGRFNFRLTCGAGWIFPKSKLNDVQTLLSA